MPEEEKPTERENFFFRLLKKAARDLLSTMYDDFEFKYMSAPRVWGWIACLTVVEAQIGEQYFGYKFSGWTQLVTWATACLGAYAAKKISEGYKGGPPNAQ